jgi:ribosome maturation protein SDO1
VRIAVKLKADEYGRCYEDMKEMGKIIKEEWQKNGDWIGVVEIPAGLRDDLFNRLNSKTHGEVETKQLK